MSRKVLYSVLDWGLGHATRSIPVIGALQSRGVEVVLASDSKALTLLQQEFPGLESHQLPSYNVEYSSRSLLGNVVKNTRRIYQAIRKEHNLVTALMQQEDIDAVVTDNRYGSYFKGKPNVIITHQLKFRTGNKVLDTAAELRVKSWVKPFDLIWIPDDPEHTLSGVLSMTNDPRKRYIGWLSTIRQLASQRTFDLAAIISGPEPQRTSLEERVFSQLESLPLKCAVIRGVPGTTGPRERGNITVYDFAGRDVVNRIIAESGVVLCRSGYSSLMDLQKIGKRAILTPTPGQPEQEYLADRMAKLTPYVIQHQDKLDIEGAIRTLSSREAPTPDSDDKNLLNRCIDEFIAML